MNKYLTFEELKQDAEKEDWLHNTLYNHINSEWANVKLVEVITTSAENDFGWQKLVQDVVFEKDGLTYLAETVFSRNDHGETQYDLLDIYPVEKVEETVVVTKWDKIDVSK